MKTVPESEIKITFARSGGAGGQNVNKTSTKATIHWSIKNSFVFTDEEKERLRKFLSNKINHDDEVVVSVEQERSQLQNRNLAIEKLQELVSKALYIPKKRKATKPSFASKVERLDAKKKRSRLKKDRKIIFE